MDKMKVILWYWAYFILKFWKFQMEPEVRDTSGCR